MTKIRAALIVAAFSLLMACLSDPAVPPQDVPGWLYLLSLGAALGLLADWAGLVRP